MSYFELEGRNLCLVATPGPGGSSTGHPSDEPTFTERILALLDQIRAQDNGRGPSGENREHKEGLSRRHLPCQRRRSCSADHRADRRALSLMRGQSMRCGDVAS